MNTRQTLELLSVYESRNVTFVERDGSWPIVWDRARGVHVWDAEGRRYVDLTAAFGVAAAGHANARVVRAGRDQMGKLLHAMGDVHPHALKAQLARELSRLTFERWLSRPDDTPGPATRGKVIFCNSGFEAVEAALKTALLATARPGVIAFEGAYHGLGYGVLNTTHRGFFRTPFARQLVNFGHFLPFPEASGRPGSQTDLSRLEARLKTCMAECNIGAILVEPVQGRGGIRVPNPGFLPMLRRLCDRYKALLIVDEIYTGFGRTGKWFACEHWGTVPDLICLGKALTGGFPLSACVGRAALMDAAWPPSHGEAIHTSTFLGHPVGCAMALAQVAEIKSRKLVAASGKLGNFLLECLRAELAGLPCVKEIRGLGLMAGVELCTRDGKPGTDLALAAMKSMLGQGYIVLPDGEWGNVISFTPPLTITRPQLRAAARALSEALA